MDSKLKNIVNKHFWGYSFGNILIVCILAVLATASSSISCSSFLRKTTHDKEIFFKPVIDELLRRGVKADFIYELLSSDNVKFDERFVKINVTGYLSQKDYSHFFDEISVRRTKEFLFENARQLAAAEKRYKVPKEVIAAILWIETRHGNYLGKSNIASVFFSTAMCNQPEFIQLNKQTVRADSSISIDNYARLDSTIDARATRKSQWALEELIALERMRNSSPEKITDICGSWAGAYGIPQFLPTSYIKWAVDGDHDGVIDLFDMDDAIFSVGNYLKCNGWTSNRADQQSAVFFYNNSTDYVNAVLTLVDKFTETLDINSIPYDEQMQILNSIRN